MLSWRKNKRVTASEETPAFEKPAGKGRPTVSRKEAQSKNFQPLIPKDRKAAKKALKEKTRTKNEKLYALRRKALITGEEKYLPYRDQGEQRRYLRDRIDERYTISEFTVVVLFACLIALMVISALSIPGQVLTALVTLITYLFYLLVVCIVVESTALWVVLKKKMPYRDPSANVPKGSWFYLLSRVITMRRLRSPKPQVERSLFRKKTPTGE